MMAVGRQPSGDRSSPTRQPGPFDQQGRLFRLVEYLIIASAYAYHLIEMPHLGWRHILLWSLIFGAFIAIAQGNNSAAFLRWPMVFLAARLGLAIWAIWLAQIGFLPTFLPFIVIAHAYSVSQRAGIILSGITVVGVYGIAFTIVGTRHLNIYISLIPWLAGLGFVSGLTLLAIREREARTRSDELLVALSEAHRQLQEYAEQASAFATIQERNRLAREIHDSLGHYLTIVNVQLESALALRERDAARADRAVGEAKRLASEALADVRRSVAALRPSALDEVSVRQAIERQVADFRDHSGLTVVLDIAGDERHCSQATGLALYRAVQEGLTNIRKHADATTTTVTLHFTPVVTELIITDDGRGPSVPASATGGGFGLVGLRERLGLLGGTLEIAPGQGGGTVLRAVIPGEGPAS